MIKYLNLLIIAGLFVFSGCDNVNNGGSPTPPPEPTETLIRFQHIALDIMDTVVHIIGYDHSEESFNEKLEVMHNEFMMLYDLFTIFHPVEGINNLYTVNAQAGIAPVAVDPLIIEMLQYGISAYHYTNGAFNITLGPVLRIWHEQRLSENPVVPYLGDLIDADMLSNIEDLIIDEEAGTVFLAAEGMSLDVGGLAKGFAVEHVAQLGYSLGLSSILVSAGGDTRMMDGPPETGTWGNGVQNPQTPGDMTNLIDVLRVANMAVVTSGTYQRFFEADGVRYHHIIDPLTLMPSNLYDSITVLHDNTIKAEILSTALLIKSISQGTALLEQLGGHALWVLPDGTVYVSEGYREFSDNF